jgi:hypothetical protein
VREGSKEEGVEKGKGRKRKEKKGKIWKKFKLENF